MGSLPVRTAMAVCCVVGAAHAPFSACYLVTSAAASPAPNSLSPSQRGTLTPPPPNTHPPSHTHLTPTNSTAQPPCTH